MFKETFRRTYGEVGNVVVVHNIEVNNISSSGKNVVDL
jgi:hypothetical protein